MPNYLCVKDPPPFKHQEDFFYFAWDKKAVALFLDIGCGKTRALIDLADNRYKEGQINSVLVIAPNGVHRQWESKELPAYSAVEYETFRLESGINNSRARSSAFELFCQKDNGKLRWLLTNTEIFSRATYLPYFRSFLQLTSCFLIVDESSRIKSIEANRTHNILFGLSDTTRYGKKIIASKPLSKYRAVASGSMVTNSPFDLYSVMSFLQPDYFGVSFSSFKSRYGLERTDHVPGDPSKQFKRRLSLKEMREIRKAKARGMGEDIIARVFAIADHDVRYILEHPNLQVPYKNLDELKHAIKPVSFIVRKEDCLDLPEKNYEKRYVEFNAEQKRVYKEMCVTLESEYHGVELTALNALSLLVRLSQITSGFFPSPTENEKVLPLGDTNPKIQALCSVMEDSGLFPCIVICRFVAEAKAAKAALSSFFPERTTALIVGEVAKDARQDILTSFMDGDVDILVATSATVGMGFNLQIASVAYFLSNDYSFDKREQTEGRIHRAGSVAEKVVYVDFLIPSTIDERVYSVLREKRDLLDYMRSVKLGEFLGGKE
jgi:SNF2 family DNA or RNA helicase